MGKNILITGATDGIGLLTAQKLTDMGHSVILHGRNDDKLAAVARQIGGSTKTFNADLSKLDQVVKLADFVAQESAPLDVLINNAGVLKTAAPINAAGFDVRFVVNTFAPYLLTQRLLPIIPAGGRVVNLSSAAQASVNLDAMAGGTRLDDMAAYAQSKLAITIWSQELAKHSVSGPIYIAVNPGSLLASKMVKEGFGVPGKDLNIGADILCAAALSEDFAGANGQYFDNDSGQFAAPHPAARDDTSNAAVMNTIRASIETLLTA